MPFFSAAINAERSVPRTSRNLAILLGLAALVPPQLSAQEQDDSTTSERLAGLKGCRSLTESTARLACFDREVAVIVEATDTGEVRVVDREDVTDARRGLFGFSLPKFGIFSGDKDDELAKRMETEITSLRRIDSDSWVITVAEGSVWQIANAHRGFKPRVGAPVELERAAMGSFWVRLDGQIGVKGRRIQ